MDGLPIRDGALAFQGDSILDVGLADTVVSRHPDAEIIDRLGDVVLPGLINAHTHLELSEFTSGQARS